MDYAIILMIFNFIKSISEFLASILIIICADKYLKKHCLMKINRTAAFSAAVLSFKNDLLTAFQSSFILCIFYSSALYTSTSFFR